MSDPDRERRRYARMPVVVQVRIALTGQDFRAETHDLSAGGVLLDTARRLPAGTHVDLRIEVPVLSSYLIRAGGEVVRTLAGEKSGLAVRFTGISETDRELLVELTQENSKK